MSLLHGLPNASVVIRGDLAVDPGPVRKDVLHDVIAQARNLIRELVDCLHGDEKKSGKKKREET